MSEFAGSLDKCLMRAKQALAAIKKNPLYLLHISEDDTLVDEAKIDELHKVVEQIYINYYGLKITSAFMKMIKAKKPKKTRDPLGAEDTYDQKRRIATMLNDAIRLRRATLIKPGTTEPCVVFAVKSRDGRGRYTLENRHDHSRSGSYDSLEDLMPFTLESYSYPKRQGKSYTKPSKNWPGHEW